MGGNRTRLQGIAGNSVSFRMRRLEPVVGIGLFVATVWVTMASNGGSIGVWLAALAGLAVAGWSQSFPAAHSSLMFARASMLLVVALALNTETVGHEAAMPYYFWLPAIALAYAVLLPPVQGVCVVILCALGLLLSYGFSPSPASLRQALTELGLQLIVSVSALAFGRAMHEAEGQAEASMIDTHSGIYNLAGLLAHGRQLMRDCNRSGRDLTMVLLNCRDLGDVRELLGREAAGTLFGQAVQGVTRAAPRSGLVARIDRLEFVLILPGMSADAARGLVQSVLGSPPGLTLRLGDKNVHVLLDAAVASPSKNAKSVQALLDILQSKIHQRRRPTAPKPSRSDSGDSVLDESGGPLSRLELSPTLPMALSRGR